MQLEANVNGKYRLYGEMILVLIKKKICTDCTVHTGLHTNGRNCRSQNIGLFIMHFQV